MPLHIDRVETEMDVLPESSSGSTTPSTGLTGPDGVLRERLRPIVLEILEEELERLRREMY